MGAPLQGGGFGQLRHGAACVGVGDGDAERIGCVGARQAGELQQAAHHFLNLRFGRPPVAGHGFFHLQCGVFGNGQLLAHKRRQTSAARLPQLKQTLSRWQAAAREGAADAQNVDEAAQALRDAQAEIDVAAAEAQVAQRKLEQLRAQHKRQELRAPEAGTVVRLATHAGSQAVPGTPAVVLLPQRPLQVRAEINESFAAAVREGMRATVTLDADGAAQQQLPSARVLRISPVYGTARLQDDQQRGPVRVIECVLVFEQAPAAAVRVGQNVRVQFHE